MRCLNPALSLVLFLAASATAFTPLERRKDERSWTPARETGAPSQDRVGWSPKPTDGPVPPPRYGGMDLLRRDFTMGTDTCGFVSGFSSAPVTCVRQNAYCTNDGVGNMDCCTGEYSRCTSSMYSSCLDYSASEKGACSSKGPRTICCWSESPSCYTLIYSTSATPGKIFSILQCQATGGLDTLLATPPNYASTASRSSSSSSSSTTDPAAGPATTTPGGGGGGSVGQTSSSSTPVGAIVGGVVGGVAAIGLIAFLIFFFLIRNRRNANAQHNAVLPPQPQLPDVVQTPQSGFPNQGQFPPQAQYAQGQGQGPTDFKPYGDPVAQQQQQHLQPGYPQGAYGGYYQPTSPPATGMTGTTPTGSTSPGPQNQGWAPPYGQGGPYQPPVQPLMELPVHHPLGTGVNRAELGQ